MDSLNETVWGLYYRAKEVHISAYQSTLLMWNMNLVLQGLESDWTLLWPPPSGTSQSAGVKLCRTEISFSTWPNEGIPPPLDPGAKISASMAMWYIYFKNLWHRWSRPCDFRFQLLGVIWAVRVALTWSPVLRNPMWWGRNVSDAESVSCQHRMVLECE